MQLKVEVDDEDGDGDEDEEDAVDVATCKIFSFLALPRQQSRRLRLCLPAFLPSFLPFFLSCHLA